MGNLDKQYQKLFERQYKPDIKVVDPAEKILMSRSVFNGIMEYRNAFGGVDPEDHMVVGEKWMDAKSDIGSSQIIKSVQDAYNDCIFKLIDVLHDHGFEYTGTEADPVGRVKSKLEKLVVHEFGTQYTRCIKRQLIAVFVPDAGFGELQMKLDLGGDTINNPLPIVLGTNKIQIHEMVKNGVEDKCPRQELEAIHGKGIASRGKGRQICSDKCGHRGCAEQWLVKTLDDAGLTNEPGSMLLFGHPSGMCLRCQYVVANTGIRIVHVIDENNQYKNIFMNKKGMMDTFLALNKKR